MVREVARAEAQAVRRPPREAALVLVAPDRRRQHLPAEQVVAPAVAWVVASAVRDPPRLPTPGAGVEALEDNRQASADSEIRVDLAAPEDSGAQDLELQEVSEPQGASGLQGDSVVLGPPEAFRRMDTTTTASTRTDGEGGALRCDCLTIPYEAIS